jgi:uncharacterized protein (DUF362 family)/Pyruvate/2-oxoacid:ferredoxin oxidoreductase delta subunit
MSEVLLLRRERYDREGISSAVEAVFSRFGGSERLVKPGDKVLLKVNLVSAREPERRVTTDPSVVRETARAILDLGAHPVIADSPGIDSFQGAARKAGLMDVARELGIPCVELDDPVPLPPAAGASFHKIEVARLALESDVIINLPKMKTHAQMLLTLGVKNMFGCVVAQRKAEWHYKVGLRRDLFASLLLDIWSGIRPALTIMDGVIGMDGLGPTNGRPFPYGVVGGARDALAMDFLLCGMMGVKLEDYPLWQAAAKRGMPQCSPRACDLAGDFPPSHVWLGVEIPKLSNLAVIPLLSGMPFGKRLEQALISRPAHRPERCVACGKCVAVCRAEAVSLNAGKLAFDYKKCVRCYCCHEMCPVDAIEFKDGLIMKMTKLFGR